MRSSETLDDYAEILNPSSVAQFLATQRWSCHTDRAFAQLWVGPAAMGDTVRSVVLPRDPNFADFGRRWAEAVENISSIFGYRVSDLAEQVAAIHADLLFVRVDQSMSDGTIPLQQAAKLLQNIDVMIRSAALAAYNPLHTGRGRIPDTVKDFLSDEVRMGHTKKGSFIITVAARLDEVDNQPLRSAQQAHHGPADEVGNTGAESAPMPSFTRQVMSTLSRTLEATKRHVSKGDDFVDLESAVKTGLRLPLVEALRSIGEADGLKSVEMSFEWAASEPAENDLPVHIKLSRKSLSKLPQVEERLRRIEPDRAETIVGPVVELKRSEDLPTAADSGEVVIRADIDGKSRKVTVPLEGSDYDWAIRAHRAKQPYVVSGILGKKGRSWRLVDDVVPDVSFLENHFSTIRTLPG
jgi:hypothetical protein